MQIFKKERIHLNYSTKYPAIMLLTKLHIPHAGNNVVHRPELFEKLNSGLSRKLILVSAPAGYGKTTLISDWISQNKITAAWLSLDYGDNDPAVFLSYVISGIQSIHHEYRTKCSSTFKLTRITICRINYQSVNQRSTQHQSKHCTGTRRFSYDHQQRGIKTGDLRIRTYPR